MAERQQVRVLQVVLSLDPGGTERLILDLVSALHPEFPMAVCCLDAPGAWAAELDVSQVTLHALRRRPGFHPSIGLGVSRAARRHGATLIHAHQYSPFVYSCISRFSGANVPIIFTEHGRLSDAPASMKRRLVNSVLRRVAASVVAVSSELKGHLQSEGFAGKQIRTIYNGIKPSRRGGNERASRRADLGVRDNTVIVGTVARLSPVKDLRTLVQAASTVTASGRDILFLIVGDGPERAALEQLALNLGVSGNIRFLGHRDDARDWLEACDIFVNSSRSEGISLTILEAMAAGLPVVASRVGGTPEVVDQSCGRLFPAGAPEALAAEINTLTAARGLREVLGAHARARVEANFTLQRMVAEYRTLYLDCLNGASSADAPR